MFKNLFINYLMSIDDNTYLNLPKFIQDKAMQIWFDLDAKLCMTQDVNGEWYCAARLNAEDEKIYCHLTYLNQI